MNLYEGIFLRKSVRKYKMESVGHKLLGYIMNFAERLEMLDEAQRVRYEIIENLDEKSLITGPFSVKAPYYLVITSYPCMNYEVNAGFLMEQLMLYMMTKELGTCFMQYHKGLRADIKNGYKVSAVLAFGKTEQGIFRESDRAKRLPLKDICFFKEAVEDDMKIILNAGRLAPSSINNQPWRFLVYENRIHLFCRKNSRSLSVLKKLRYFDMGIALANMYLAAEELWYQTGIGISENISEKSFKNNEYILTIYFEK